MTYLFEPMPAVGISKAILASLRAGRPILLRKNNSVFLIVIIFNLYKWHRLLCSYVGCYVPFGAKVCRGLVPHGLYGGFLSKSSQIMSGCTILHCVTVGSNPLSSKPSAPKVGSYSFIGAGAKLIGGVTIERRSAIAVNEVVS